jgi:hypothetical protein
VSTTFKVATRILLASVQSPKSAVASTELQNSWRPQEVQVPVQFNITVTNDKSFAVVVFSLASNVAVSSPDMMEIYTKHTSISNTSDPFPPSPK